MPTKEKEKEVTKDFETKEFKGKNSKKPFNRQRGKGDDKDYKKGGKKICMNDSSWYVLNDQNVKDVFSLAFANVVGLPYKVGPAGCDIHLPSVIGLNYTPVPGRCLQETDAFNLATRNLYTFVRHMNSGHTNYDSVDLGIYLYAVGSLIGRMAHLERILSICNTFSAVNRSLAITLLAACIQTTTFSTVNNYLRDVQANSANYRARLGILLSKLATLAIPTGYSWIERLIWMNSNVFKDHESPKADLYVYVPNGEWSFNSVLLSTGGCLVFNNNNATKFSQELDNFESVLDAILSDEDMAIMSGDIRKAFSEERLYKYAFLPENTILQPVFVEEMLPQIHNANTIPGMNPSHFTEFGNMSYLLRTDSSSYESSLSAADYAAVQSNLIICQVDGVLKSAFCTGKSGTYTTQADVKPGLAYIPKSYCPTGMPTNDFENEYEPLNSYKIEPMAEDVAIATRLKSHYRISPITVAGVGDAYACQIMSHGTEICTHLSVFRYVPGNTNIGNAALATWTIEIPGNPVFTVAILQAMTKFDWYPISYALWVNSGAINLGYLTGDLDNFTSISSGRLDTMHLSAVLAEFMPPELKFVK